MNLARKIFLAILCLLAPLAATYLAQRVSWRMDWTAEGLYSLSDPSRDILKKLDEPISFTLYYTPDVENVPVRIRSFAQRVEAMLHQYAKAAPDPITVVVVNPAPDTRAEEEAVGAGLSGQRLANGEVLYLGLVARTEDDERVIPFLLPAREPALEYDLSRLILDLIHPEKPRVGILTSLDLWDKKGDPIQGIAAKAPSILIEELRRIFDVVPLDRRNATLPEDLDLIALLHPRGVSDQLAFAIDQYFLAGGPLLIALDPSSAEVRRTHPNRNALNGLGGPTQSDLPDLLSAWGIKYNPRRVVGDFELATNVRLSADEPELPHPLWLTYRNPQSDTVATTGLSEILLIEAGSYTVENPDLRVTPILETTAQSGEMMASSVPITSVEDLPNQISPDGRSELIAALIQGVFPTAFPDGEPSENEEMDWLKQLEQQEDPSLKQSTSESNLVLITDTDLFTDRFGTETVRYLSQQTT
ncbi:MAG: Gldg family protein, partial [Puniceicoccales bacterium]